jgi:hypothetical protein
VGFVDAERSCHNRQQHCIDGVFFADNRHDSRIPGLRQELRILTGDENDAFGICQGEGQPFEHGLIEDQHALTRCVRSID